MTNKDYRDETLALLVGDARERLRDLPDGSVQCVITSPPYFGLRDYGVAGQIGLEGSLDAYIESLIDVFAQVHRVLRVDGTVWLNLGDSYANTGGSAKRQIPHGDGRPANADRYLKERVAVPSTAVSKSIPNGIKPKELIGVPWRVAFALQAAGWYLRADIIWAKKNPMPESVKDRPTRSHEFMFLLTKSPHYYYDAEAVREPSTMNAADWGKDGKPKRASKKRGELGGKNRAPGKEPFRTISATRNRRDVWTIATRPFAGAHFATFPPDLVEPCVLAGSAPGDVVLDPFGGAGTTALVANKHGRRAVLIELNPDYARLTLDRLGRTKTS
jgi:DNA modification methylase